MRIPLYQVDAFAARLFSGNPAAVCPLAGWLPNTLLEAIAAENNLSETAFLVGGNGRYHIRWFTPTVEVDLCGHATLAAAYVVGRHLEPGRDRLVFDSRSGPLPVSQVGDAWELDFPARSPEPCPAPSALAAGLGIAPREVWRSDDYLALLADEDEVRRLTPDFARLATLDSRGVIVTAPGRECDFVSRFFAPQSGIAEDPVTGSAHATLAPFWAPRLAKRRFAARQLSARGGELTCELREGRVLIRGRAVEYLAGSIEVPDLECGNTSP